MTLPLSPRCHAANSARGIRPLPEGWVTRATRAVPPLRRQARGRLLRPPVMTRPKPPHPLLQAMTAALHPPLALPPPPSL